jgi:hypothetical protein
MASILKLLAAGAGQASADITADLAANSTAAQALVAALKTALGTTSSGGTSSTLANDFAYGARPQTGVYSTDSFVLPANAPGTAWPGFKTTSIPFTTATNPTSAFGTWSSDGTTFTFATAGVYSVTGGIGLVFVGGTDINANSRVVGRLSYLHAGTSYELSTPINTSLTASVILGQDLPIAFDLVVAAGDTLQIQGTRTPYTSSQSDDWVGTNYAASNTKTGWLRIVRIR